MKMRAALVFLAAAAASPTWARPRWHELTDGYSFDRYEREFGKTYGTLHERETRERLFRERLSDIVAHNSDPAQSYKRGLNHLSDRTAEEMSAMMLGLNAPLLHKHKQAAGEAAMIRAGTKPLPESVDWRQHSPAVVTPVKNQGECGSCWAFASTETLESHWALATGKLEDMSPQFILDCTPNPDDCGGTGGCGGGTAALAYDALKRLGGMPSEWTYPYISGNAGAKGECHGLPLSPEQPHDGAVTAAANVTGYVAVASNNYDAVMRALAEIGPLTVTVDAGGWHDYEEGIFDGGNATDPDLNHLVQLVGYGVDSAETPGDGGLYFLVRNSWTPTWGEAGYIKLRRSPTPTCGTDTNPGDGDGCKGGPTTVRVCGQSGVLYDAVYPTVK